MNTASDGSGSEPSSGTECPSLPLCGRAGELSMLRGALNRAASGESSRIVLVGPKGMGKSRLARATAEEAERRGFRIASGTAYPLESGVPWALICDLLDPLLRGESPETLMALTRGAPEFRFVLPSLTLHDSAGTDPAAESVPDLRNRLLWNFPAFLDRLRRDLPLLLIVEDMEWADPSSLELLHFLVRRPLELPIVLVGTLDPEGSPEGPVLMEALRGVADRTEAELRRLAPLTPDAVVELVAQGFGADPEVVRGFSEELCRWTGGNPLFLTATLEHLVEGGRLQREGGRWVGWETRVLSPPTSVEALVLERAERLSTEAGSVAGLAAVIGPKVRFEVLAEASGLDEPELLRALDELRERGFLREDTEGDEAFIAFVHPILRQVFYRSLGTVRARRMHGEVLQALIDLYGERALDHADELAVHLDRVGPTADPRRSARILVAAGRQALQTHANLEAARYLERALEVLPDETDPAGDRAAILVDLARACQRRGRYADATRFLTEARESLGPNAPPGDLAGIDRRLGFTAFWAGRSDEALEHWERGLGVLDGEDALEARLRLARSACLQERGEVDEAAAEAGEALRLGGEVEDIGLQVSAHMSLTLLHTWAGPSDRARYHGTAALTLAEGSGEATERLSAHWAMAVLEGLTGHPPALREHMDQAWPLADALGSPLLKLRLAEVEIEYAARVGQWDRGGDLAAESLRMARELNQRLALPRLLVLSGLLHLARGDVERAERELDEAWVRTGTGTDARPMTMHTAILARAGRAALHLARGEFPEAVAMGEEGMDLVDRSGYRAWGIHRLLPTIAEASLHLRDLERARAVAARLRREGQRFDHPAARAWSAICEALVVWLDGDPARGAREMAEGADTLEEIGLLPDAARLRRQVAGRLAETGDHDGAVRELRRAHEILSGLGAIPELEKARDQFREIGARPPVRSEGERGPELLTSREIEIARLIGQRKSNKAVARELGISPRTVGTHLTNIFRKLELGSRWELGDRVREGILDSDRAPCP